MGRSRSSSGRHPPEGPPIWTALNRFPSGGPPTMSKMSCRRVVPIGTSTSPVFRTLPVREKILVPGEVSVPKERNQSAPFRMMWGTLAQVSTLLMLVGRPPRPRWAGKGGRGRGCPRLPFDGGKERRLLPAHERPRPLEHVQAEGKTGPQDVLAQKPQLLGLSDGDPKVLHCQGVFGPDVDVALIDPDGIDPISIPSITAWGFPSRTLRSMYAPGSPSSALQMTYFLGPLALR